MRKILILAANPNSTTRLRLDQEVRDIADGLRRSQYRNEFELIQRWAVRPRDMQRAMLDETPQIVHFSGHGAGAEGLAFEDNMGNARLVSSEALASLFNLFSDRLECVLLNGCYSEVQARAIVQHINYVIGLSQAITDAASIKFAVAFYGALGAGRSYEFAYQLACNAIQFDSLANQDSSRKLIVDTAGKSKGEHLFPILLKHRSLSGLIETASIEETLEANLKAVEAAGQARIEVLDRQISEEESKLRATLTDQTREALDWLKQNQKKLAHEAKNSALSLHTDVFNGLSMEEQDDFRWEIEKYIESVYFSMLSSAYDLIDEPIILPSIHALKVYQSAFEFIKQRIPPRLEKTAREALSSYFDYLLSRLFVQS